MQVQQKQALKRLENSFISFRDKLKSALPEGYDVDREISSILATVASSTALQRCTPESILMSAYNAATLGLPVNSLGLAYLVPYGNEAKFQIGYQGQLHLMYETGFVGSVDAEVVYENDKFEFTLGSKPTIEHKPCKGERGKITNVYAIAHLTNGLSKQVILTKEDIEHIRKSSKSGNNPSSPWVTHYPAMCKKTAIRQLSKFLPKYANGQVDRFAKFRRATELEEEQFSNEARATVPVTEYSHSETVSDSQEQIIDAQPIETEPFNEPPSGSPLLGQLLDLQSELESIDATAKKLPDTSKFTDGQYHILIREKKAAIKEATEKQKQK